MVPGTTLMDVLPLVWQVVVVPPAVWQVARASAAGAETKVTTAAVAINNADDLPRCAMRVSPFRPVLDVNGLVLQRVTPAYFYGHAEITIVAAGGTGVPLAAARATASSRAASMVAPAPPATTLFVLSAKDTMQRLSLVTSSLVQS